MPIDIEASPVAEEAAAQRFTLTVPFYRALICIAIAFVAVLIHGYHPYAVDGSIYVPAIKKLLHPEMYPQDAEFFLSPTRLSIFAKLIAASVRVTSIPLEYILPIWQVGAIAAFLAGCWRLGRICFGRGREALLGMLLVASLLTIPVAGTSLILFEPYLTSRSLSTPAVLMMICCVLERKFARAALWLIAAALVHPLMAGFGAVFSVIVYAIERRNWPLLVGTGAASWLAMLLAMLWTMKTPVSPAYRAAVLTRSYFFLSHWTWYEILGLIAPLLLFALLIWYLLRNGNPRKLVSCSLASLIYGTVFFFAGVMVSSSPQLLGIARFQPLRAFHLLYVLLFLLPVNFAVSRITATRPAVLVGLLASVAGLMFVIQRQTFPSSAHIEWPWSHTSNRWMEAFDWVRANTPKDAVFALDGQYTENPGEDCQGFNARAERSSLADVSKDGGVAAIFPDIAPDWAREIQATSNINRISSEDDLRTLADAGVSWILLRRDKTPHLDCPYENSAVAVCRIPATIEAHSAAQPSERSKDEPPWLASLSHRRSTKPPR